MPANEQPYDALARFAVSVFAVNGVLLQSGDDVTRPIGQSSARWQVLGRAGHQPQTVARMAREIGNSRQAVQRLADALVRDGLARFVDNPADKRARLLELTPRGAAVLAEIDARDRVWSQRILPHLDLAELDAISAALERVRQVFEAHPNPHEGADR